MTKTSQFDLTDPKIYNFWTEVSLRYSDQDDLGHVNNVAYAAFVEAGRTDLLYQYVDYDKYPKLNFMLANVNINYLQECHWPGTMRVGSRLTNLGTKSITTGYGLFLDGICRATAECVNVYFDTDTRKSVAPPEDLRAKLMDILSE
ncbi:MAG: acyl-CoA thioesterase [Rhodospirillales bacterium]|nr:acyl-CoA thioesterase [Rhodospirillales bacterium]